MRLTRFGLGLQERSRLDGADYLRLTGMLASGFRAAGDVHGIARHDIPKIRESFGDSFRCAVLVRDPFPRFRSQLALFSKFAHARCWSIDYLKTQIPEAAGLLPTESYDEWLFVHGVNMLNNIIEEVEVGPVVRMEDITRSVHCLERLFRHLTDDSIPVSKDWAAEAIKSSATNRHAFGDDVPLLKWQHRVIEAVLSPRAIELYRSLGYDLSFQEERLQSNVGSRNRVFTAKAAGF